jgi:hypothetical protein
MSTKKQKTAFFTEDVTDALRCADKFNAASGASPQNRAATIISKSIDFMYTHRDAIQKGGFIEFGSAWSGPSRLLDKDIAREVANKKTSTDQIAGDFDIALTVTDQKKLSSIRECFKLTSDKQAGRLAVQIYTDMLGSLWQGNGFRLTDTNDREHKLDIKKIKSGLTFRY